MGNNALDSPSSNTDSFVLRDTCVPSINLHRHLWRKHNLSLPETLNLQEVLIEKLPQFSPGNNKLDAPASNTDGFLSRDS
jgi:hypothetical protein